MPMHPVPPSRPRDTRRMPRQLLDLVTGWPVASQQRARRNAMIASTAMAQRRAEREAVADFLAARAGVTDPAPVEDRTPDTRSSGL